MIEKTRILYGIESTHGGSLKHLLYLVSRLDRNRFELTVALSDKRGNIDAEIAFMKDHHTKVLRIPMVRNINPVRDLISFAKICRLLTRNKFHVVHAHSSKAGALFCFSAWLCNVRQIFYTPHCFRFQAKRGLVKYIFIVMEKIISLFYSVVIVSDNELKEALKYNITPQHKIRNINNAIDLDEYQFVTDISIAKEKFCIGKDDVVVGSIGRLTAQKDWYTYILAAKGLINRYPSMKFLIVGNGEQQHSLQKFICKNGLQQHVILTGYIVDIRVIYSILNIYVSSSVWEGLPYVLLEAMRYNLPIVATNTGNDEVVVHGKTGFVVEKRDHKAVGQCIEFLMSNPEHAHALGYAGSCLLKKKYSFKSFIAHHESLYSTCSSHS